MKANVKSNTKKHSRFAVPLTLLAGCSIIPKAAAHHVFGMEVSPVFEVFHTLAEPLLFAASGASLAWLLYLLQIQNFRANKSISTNHKGRRFISIAKFSLLITSACAMFLASAAIYEGVGFLFLIVDASAFTTLFVLLARYLPRQQNKKVASLD